MSEKLTGGYEELEQGIIEESVERFIAKQNSSDIDIVSDEQDPRVVQTVKTAESVGFSMEAGQYINLIS